MIRTYQRISVRIASFDAGVNLRIAADISDSGSCERGLNNKAVPNNRLIEHIGNNATYDTAFTIVLHLASRDKAIGDFSVTSETCGDTARAHTLLEVLNSRILHAEARHRTITIDNAEWTYHAVSIYVSIADSVSTTIVVTAERSN